MQSTATFPAKVVSHRSVQQQIEKTEKVETFCMAYSDIFKWNFENLKSTGILRSSGFWQFFQICKIPLASTSKGHEKCHRFCCIGAHTDPHS
jgi:hypothetical protein